MKYDKLVRDKIPEIIGRTGKKATYRVLNEDEYKEYLERKLDEEVAEFHKGKSIEELADIEEVLRALLNVKNVSYDEVVKALAEVLDSDVFKLSDTYFKKNRERGGFEKHLCLLEVED